MFVAIAGPPGAAAAPGFEAMAGALRGAPNPARCWRDAALSVGLAGAPSGILPEDRFDRQPWRLGGLCVASAGRLDNRAELLARLGVSPGDGAKMADSEIVARACARWGEDAPQQLYGDWAFVAWNEAERSLIAAVNHLAVIPIFYHRRGERLHLATQLAALLAHPATPSELDRRVLGLHVAPRRVEGATMWGEIRQAPPGALLVWRDGELTVRRWWRPDTGERRPFRRDRDYVDQASELFDEAVAQRMRTTGEVAAALSGGLDSPLVAATAARSLAALGRGLDVFTAVPEPGLWVEHSAMWDADDWPYAAAVVRMHANMRHHAAAPGGVVPVDILPAVHRASRSPTRNTNNQVWFLHIVHEAKARGARVILGGDSGNFSLTAGGAFGPADWLRPARYRFLLDHARFRLGRAPLGGRVLAKLRQATALAADLGDDGGLRPGWRFLTPAFREEHRSDLARRPRALSRRQAFTDMATAASGLGAVGADLMAMFGSEWRDPMNDRRLLETLVTYPFAVFRTGGRDRGLAREVARGRLPDLVRLRYTRGSQAPDAAAWFQAHAPRYRAAFETVKPSPTCQAIFDLAHLERTLDALCGGDFAQDHVTTHRVLDAGLFAAAWEAGAW